MYNKKHQECLQNKLLVKLEWIYYKWWAGNSNIKRGETIGIQGTGLKECI